MGKVTANMSMSLDGFIAGPNDSPENPLGDDDERIHEWVFGLASWRDHQGLEGGKANRNSEFIAETFDNLGAVVMGRRMFSNAEGPWDDPPFEGHWGEDPPFRTLVFVPTHDAGEPLVMDGGTTFTFIRVCRS